MIKLIITDDHKIIRDGIKALLKDESEMQVVGEAADGNELIQVLSTTFADVVLLDLNMPNRGGLDTIQYLNKNFPDVKILVLSMLNHESFVNRMLEAGALGYVLKNAGKKELSSAIGLVASGTPYICSEIAIELLKKSVSSPTVLPVNQQEEPSIEQQKELSKRELEVLYLIAEGFTNAEIAEKLFTSKRTIETHRQNLLEKTQMKNTATLIKYALQKGIIA